MSADLFGYEDPPEPEGMSSEAFIKIMHARAIEVYKTKKPGATVSSDDLRGWADQQGISPRDPIAWSNIFRHKCWAEQGMKRSTVKSNKARRIRHYAWIGP